MLSRITHCYIYVLAFLESLFLLHLFQAAGVETVRVSFLCYSIISRQGSKLIVLSSCIATGERGEGRTGWRWWVVPLVITAAEVNRLLV